MENTSREPLVLVLDDEKNIRKSIELVLGNEGINVLSAHEPGQALRFLYEHNVDLIILDIELGEIDGLTFFKKIRSDGLDSPVLFISGHATLDEAAQAVKIGGFDFIEKPFNAEKLVSAVQHCLEIMQVKDKLAAIECNAPTIDFIGDSPQIQQIKAQALKVATSNASVLITGESGTGKELIANMIHANSDRANESFITVNCSAIPDSLLESELFGHEKGAFTGAQNGKRGYFELANHGTIFLDEVADLSLSAQAKTLRVLQNGEIQKLGSEKTLLVDIRVISGTHKDLAKLVSQGKFREDLLYRLKVVPIVLPSLRHRAADIPLLIQYFIEQLKRDQKLDDPSLTEDVITKLKCYPWPGNIRELKNVIERLLIMSNGKITVTDLPEEILSPLKDEEITQGSLREFRDQAERRFVIDCLRKHGGNITKAAQELKLGRPYLHKRISQLDITKKDYFI